jgi:hypothetical protein
MLGMHIRVEVSLENYLTWTCELSSELLAEVLVLSGRILGLAICAGSTSNTTQENKHLDKQTDRNTTV